MASFDAPLCIQCEPRWKDRLAGYPRCLCGRRCVACGVPMRNQRLPRYEALDEIEPRPLRRSSSPAPRRFPVSS
jgi:hypothetical protein